MEINVVIEDLPNEVWKDVVNYEGYYKISNMGRVKSLLGRNERLMKTHISRNGYVKLDLSKIGQTKKVYVHRLVAQAFIDNPDDKPVVNHINSDKQDNRLSNLEWVTQKENILHAIALGLIKKNNKPVYSNSH